MRIKFVENTRVQTVIISDGAPMKWVFCLQRIKDRNHFMFYLGDFTAKYFARITHSINGVYTQFGRTDD